MNTVIIYASRYGYTKDCTQLLADQLKGETIVIDADNQKEIDISEYNQVIFGGSVKIGQLQRSITTFALTHKKELLKKKLGIFVSCGDKSNYMKYLQDSLSKELLSHASLIECFGGEFRKENMKFFEKRMVNVMEKANEQKGGRPPIPMFENIKKMATEFSV
ncbi:MAG: hypothetical protein KAG94_05975 [Clostridiales bacterium]|nr:hypothetical protein [Clostridiales bacterium]